MHRKAGSVIFSALQFFACSISDILRSSEALYLLFFFFNFLLIIEQQKALESLVLVHENGQALP